MGLGTNKHLEIIVLSPEQGVRETICLSVDPNQASVVGAASFEEAALGARSASAELVIVDSQLPLPIDQALRLKKINPALGFLLILAEQDIHLAVEAARRGAYDFILRPVEIDRARFRIQVALEKHSRTIEERAYTVALEERVNDRTEEVLQNRERIKTQFINTIRALERALQAKSVYTEGHSRRVAEKAVEVARLMGASKEMLKHIELGALFHDIGKIGIRDDVLNKPGKLTESEYEHMKIHPIVAEQILSPIEELRPIVSIVKHEHERFDGSGYPDGLKGTEIPLGARLIAIADAWDSMVFDRVYRKAMSHEAALAEIQKHSGTQFCPECVATFCRLERERMTNGKVVARLI